jgi:hypothetical protein
MMGWVDVRFFLFFFTYFYLPRLIADNFADGFFDAGMLLHALKGVQADRDRAEKPARRRPVGKKLQLAEY